MTTPAIAEPVYRSATAGDRGAVEALLRAALLPTEGVVALFARDPSQFLLAVEGDDAIAVAGVEECGEYGLLRSVAVRHDRRHRGVGQEIVARAMTQAASRGISALYLLTTTAEDYFPRHGFSRIARDEVPAAIAQTVEFTSACPASAITMTAVLGGTR